MGAVVLFGAGDIGKAVRARYGNNVVAFIDNSIEKQKKTLDSLPIISLEEYINRYSFAEVIICSKKYCNEMKKQLIQNKISNFREAGELFEHVEVNIDKDICHDNWIYYLEEHFNQPGKEILEIGSRVVTGSNYRNRFSKANYTGMDYYEGPNVDIVGDIHQLTSYVEKKYDLIFCSAVFEHLAMPWIASMEIVKALKPGGMVFIETHCSFSRHEEPWFFYQFSENALNVLFPEKFGMRCIKKGCSNLIAGEFSEKASKYLQGKRVTDLYAHSEILLEKVKEVEQELLTWDGMRLDDVVGSTKYPRS